MAEKLLQLVQMGEYQSAQSAYEALNQMVETTDTKAWTSADIAKAFPGEVNLILGTLKSVPLFESAFIALSITGLDLSSDERQEFISQVAAAGNWPENLTEAIKRLGRPIKPKWEMVGLLQEPSFAEVQEAWNAVQQTVQLKAIRIRLDAAFNQIGTSEQPQAIVELRAIAHELEA
jgi:hypothetical protein